MKIDTKKNSLDKFELYSETQKKNLCKSCLIMPYKFLQVKSHGIIKLKGSLALKKKDIMLEDNKF